MAVFEKQAAIIFGGGRNIGRAVALEFARRGARVTIADIDADGAREAADAIIAAGGAAVGVRADVTDTASIAAAAAEAEAAFGPIDIVMNNAGLLHNGNPEDMPLTEWQRMFDCNLFGIVRALEVFLPAMIARGSGRIVNTASFAGLYPYAVSRTPYAASKAAILNLSENLALYLEPKGISVHCLIPGPVMTTSVHGMANFGEGAVMRGPGAHLWLKGQAEVAAILADGMAAERILIPTHGEGFDSLRDHAAAPDDFIRARIAEFAAGDTGKPQVDAAKFGLS